MAAINSKESIAGVNDATRKLYQIYPGPLIRGITHKKTIIEFCEDQIRLGPSLSSVKAKSNSMSSLYSSGLANKSSYTLMWNLLILLLRQNGVSKRDHPMECSQFTDICLTFSDGHWD